MIPQFEYFVKTSKAGYETWALSGVLPLWLSVVYVGVSRLQGNGCAPIPERGGLAALLGKPRQDINRAIRTAIKKGMLEADSVPTCLRPKPDVYEYGKGSMRTKCVHHSSAVEAKCVWGQERSREEPVIDAVQSLRV